MVRTDIFTIKKYRGAKSGRHRFQMQSIKTTMIPVEGFFDQKIDPGSQVEAELTDELSKEKNKIWKIHRIRRSV